MVASVPLVKNGCPPITRTALLMNAENVSRGKPNTWKKLVNFTKHMNALHRNSDMKRARKHESLTLNHLTAG